MAGPHRYFTPISGRWSGSSVAEEAEEAEKREREIEAIESTFILLPAITMRKLARIGRSHGLTATQMVAFAISKFVKELEEQGKPTTRWGKGGVDGVSK